MLAAGPLASGSRSRREVWKDSAEEEPPSAAAAAPAKRDEADGGVASGSAQWRQVYSTPREAPPPERLRPQVKNSINLQRNLDEKVGLLLLSHPMNKHR